MIITLFIATVITRVVARPHLTEVNDTSETPRVGLFALQACTVSTTDEACTRNVGMMVEALEADYFMSVNVFEKGVLNCDSLELAEDAPRLRFNLVNSEEVTATKKSFQVTSHDTFSDKVSRMVWTGEVVETGYVFGGIPRSIAMSWSGCDIETFKLRVIALRHDGTTRETVTLPCTDADESNRVCLLQIDHALEGEAIETSIVDGNERGNVRRRHLRENNSNSAKDSRAEGQRRLAREVSDAARTRDPDAEEKSQDVRLLNKYLMASTAEKEAFHERGVRRLSSEEVQMPSGRVLVDSKTIDVMVLYTEASMIHSKEADGTLMTTAQMESTISLSYAGVNDAFEDSGIEASINVVHTAKVAFGEGSDMQDDLSSIAKGGVFDDLRTKKGADLVQLIGFYSDGRECGTGYILGNPETFDKWAYSIVHVDCLAKLSHIHEIGHNLGANHDRDSTTTDHDYAHAYCDDDAPYRTIMAYDDSCVGAVRVPRFSTPDKLYLKKRLGSATADNARKIQENVAWAVNFRGGSLSSSASPSGTSVSALDAATATNSNNIIPPGQQQQHQRQQQQKEQQQQKQQQRPGNKNPISEADARMDHADSDRTYQGCYRHDWADLELANVPLFHRSNTSRESCRDHCGDDFAYYALEFGFMCSCGDNLPDETRMATDANCSLLCTSPSTTLSCGGNWHQAVFSVEGTNER